VHRRCEYQVSARTLLVDLWPAVDLFVHYAQHLRRKTAVYSENSSYKRRSRRANTALYSLFEAVPFEVVLVVQQREQQALVAEHGLAAEHAVPLLRVAAGHQPVAAREVYRLAAVELRKHRWSTGNAQKRRSVHCCGGTSWRDRAHPVAEAGVVALGEGNDECAFLLSHLVYRHAVRCTQSGKHKHTTYQHRGVVGMRAAERSALPCRMAGETCVVMWCSRSGDSRNNPRRNSFDTCTQQKAQQNNAL
jgi:hypothetical protein